MGNVYSITELAREFKVTTRTIRYYEDKGLLSPLREGQRRIYNARDYVRLRLIMRGKRLAFSLDEIRELIELYDVDTNQVSQLSRFLEMVRIRQQALRQQQKDIAVILAELEQREAQCEGLLAGKSN